MQVLLPFPVPDYVQPPEDQRRPAARGPLPEDPNDDGIDDHGDFITSHETNAERNDAILDRQEDEQKYRRKCVSYEIETDEDVERRLVANLNCLHVAQLTPDLSALLVDEYTPDDIFDEIKNRSVGVTLKEDDELSTLLIQA